MRSHERFRLHVAGDDEKRGALMIAVAFVANVLVAIAKTVAAVITGSSSLRTEAVHSWVDVGNEGFVVAAARSARKPADTAHPLGSGRASYVWSMFASLGTLAVGAVVGIWQGVRALGARRDPGVSEGSAGHVRLHRVHRPRAIHGDGRHRHRG
jgi:divalent metal cation (Fe/Co/Zn/Cd) transporter